MLEKRFLCCYTSTIQSIFLNIFCRYTYGKPVKGMVKATVCHNCYRYGWLKKRITTPPDICKNYKMKVCHLYFYINRKRLYVKLWHVLSYSFELQKVCSQLILCTLNTDYKPLQWVSFNISTLQMGYVFSVWTAKSPMLRDHNICKL